MGLFRAVGICSFAGVVLFSASVFSQTVTIDGTKAAEGDVAIVDAGKTATIIVDNADAEVVKIAGGLLADDVERVCGHRPQVISDATAAKQTAIIIGTIGQSPIIDKLIADKKIDAGDVQGKMGIVRVAGCRKSTPRN